MILLTTRGVKSGKLRKVPLMRVEHDGVYAIVASMGGAPKNPVWYYNLKAHPDDVVIQDGPEPFAVDVREITGDEKTLWWERATAAYRDALHTAARHLHTLTPPPSHSAKETGDLLWYWFGPTGWRTLVVENGWSWDRAEEVLRDTAVATLR